MKLTMKTKSFSHSIRQSALAGAMALLVAGTAQAADPVKVGVMLPYTGTYGALGEAITNGMQLAIEENGDKLGGRDVEYVTVDSEANPGKAPAKHEPLN